MRMEQSGVHDRFTFEVSQLEPLIVHSVTPQGNDFCLFLAGMDRVL